MSSTIGKTTAPGRSYFGSKEGSGVWQNILNQIPPHDLFVEAFAGSAAITRHKRPSVATIVIDADAAACQALRGTFADAAGLSVICADAISWLANEPLPARTVVYADPPYPFCVRSSRRKRYTYELGFLQQHQQLLEVLKKLPCPVALSGYRNLLYDRCLATWRRVDYPTMTRGGLRTESLWCNFPEPKELHDTQAVGQTFRQRQDLKRQKERWVKRLDKMSGVKRQALIGAIADWCRRSSVELPFPDPIGRTAVPVRNGTCADARGPH